jgi:hypothetical protein
VLPGGASKDAPFVICGCPCRRLCPKNPVNRSTIAGDAGLLYTGPRFVNARQRQEEKMKNPLDSLWGTVIAGLVLTVVLYYVIKIVIGG